MATGTVCFFNDIHGNGLIIPDGGGERIRFSYKSVLKDGMKMFCDGQRVEFKIIRTTKGGIEAADIIGID